MMELTSETFINYINTTELFDIQRDKILLGISGGVDSVVLAHLLKSAGANFAMAHCNFQLRGAESDGDADFVRNLADIWQIPFIETRFDTLSYMAAEGLSVQIAARELRYDWFERVRQISDYQYIATAHHLNDSIETFFMNLLKGCGIRGLQGIRNRNIEKKLVRPLTFASRAQILQYAENQQLTHREDSSNADNYYFRNQIRNQLTPLLRDFQPQLETTFEGNFQRLQDAEWLYNWGIEQWKSQVSEQRGGEIWVDKLKLTKIPIYKTLLFEILQPYSFNISQVAAILTAETGAYTDSPSHRILADRDCWIIAPLTALQPHTEKIKITLSDSKGFVSIGSEKIEYQFLPYTIDFHFQFVESADTAYFDADKLGKELELRPWQSGDIFQPSGMKGQSKTVKKFLKDSKINLYEKAKLWILTSEGRIAWLLGYRSDERFKVDTNTKTMLCLHYHKK